jgi:hypothetical protein
MSRISLRSLGMAFLAGFLAVLVLHQPMLSLLHAIGLTPARGYAMRPTPPLDVPQVFSSAFWGGIWGIISWPSVLARVAVRATMQRPSCSARLCLHASPGSSWRR